MTRRTIAVAAGVLLAAGLCVYGIAGHGPLAAAARMLHEPVADAAEAPGNPPPTIWPQAANSPAAEAATLRHGAALAAIGDCAVCHTANRAAPFAGGRPLATPFGTIYSTNITPDRDTGIGAWSLDAFSRAMRQGVSRDGHLLYPAFPYPHFTHMSDADIAALYAFLMSRDPVHATAPANDLMFPLGFRPLIAAWNLLFLHPGVEAGGATTNAAATETATRDTPADLLQRGHYLVDGPAHCAACHTPLNLLGAEKGNAAFAGAVIEGWQAPPLTTLLNAPKPWTRDQLIAYLHGGFATDHGAAAGPMRPVAQSLANAPERDVQAIADYLLSLQTPARTAPRAVAQTTASGAAQPAPAEPAVNTASLDTAPLRNGAALFEGACAQCHATHAPMTTIGERPSLALSTDLNADSPRNTLRAILGGIPAQPGTSGPAMPAFGSVFTDAQIADLAAFLRVNFSHAPAWTVQEADVATLRKETSEP